jgi:hypothetical protein
MDDEARIALEIKLAWLENLAVELDRQVRVLADEVVRLKSQVAFLEEQGFAKGEAHERPPHYGG